MKKAIIIGATSGIGLGLARVLSRNGYKVGITGRRKELLEELKKENSDAYVPICFDVQEIDAIPTHLEQLANELGGLDLLVISSGTGKISDDLDFGIEKETITTNVLGFTRIADWAVQFFENQKHGHLTAITSIAGLRGGRYAPAYSASKAYQINYMEGLRQRVSYLKLPIAITDIRPGFVDTAMAQGDTIFWLVSVEKAAKQIFSAIKSKRKVVYVSKKWVFFAWLIKIIPRWVHQRI